MKYLLALLKACVHYLYTGHQIGETTITCGNKISKDIFCLGCYKTFYGHTTKLNHELYAHSL